MWPPGLQNVPDLNLIKHLEDVKLAEAPLTIAGVLLVCSCATFLHEFPPGAPYMQGSELQLVNGCCPPSPTAPACRMAHNQLCYVVTFKDSFPLPCGIHLSASSLGVSQQNISIHVTVSRFLMFWLIRAVK